MYAMFSGWMLAGKTIFDIHIINNNNSAIDKWKQNI